MKSIHNLYWLGDALLHRNPSYLTRHSVQRVRDLSPEPRHATRPSFHVLQQRTNRPKLRITSVEAWGASVDAISVRGALQVCIQGGERAERLVAEHTFVCVAVP